MNIKHTKAWKFFSSIKLAIWLLSIIAVISLIGTFIPQNQEQAFYINKYGQNGSDILVKTGLSNIYACWWFIFCIILFSLNLLVCLINRFSLKKRMMGTVISHLSILIILAGALIGMLFGEKGMINIIEGDTADSFIFRDKTINLGFSIRLNDFIYSEHTDPKEKLLIYHLENKNTCNMKDHAEKCATSNLIATIPVDTGIESAIADTGYKVKVLRYIPDFVMDTASKQVASRSNQANNPALELELKDKKGAAKTVWVFARYPDMHQDPEANFRIAYNWAMRRPKDFISKVTVLKDGKEVLNKDIRVNEPLSFGGYSFFQSSYDSEELKWTGLQVVKDPGVPLIYSGFLLLIFGLVIIFYINPLLQRRQE